jgi:hypothetical protein
MIKCWTRTIGYLTDSNHVLEGLLLMIGQGKLFGQCSRVNYSQFVTDARQGVSYHLPRKLGDSFLPLFLVFGGMKIKIVQERATNRTVSPICMIDTNSCLCSSSSSLVVVVGENVNLIVFNLFYRRRLITSEIESDVPILSSTFGNPKNTGDSHP